MYDAILFDFDDTLVDTKASKILAIIDYCCAVHGVEVSAQQISACWGIPFRRMMSELTGSAEIHTERYLEISEGYALVPFPESHATLCALAQRLPIGIVTSLARPVLLHSLTALGWHQQLFSVLVAEDDVLAHKPDLRVFEPALQTLRITDDRRHRVVYLGDSLSDGKAALAAGLHFVGIARDTDAERLFDAEGWQYCSSLEEITRSVMQGPSLK
jgi:phosphoglycolate phosphatase